jgi:integrase
MTRTRSPWSKSIGERGHRVRLYEARPGGPIMRSTWINGKEDRKSLGHRDRELATRQAYEFLQGVLANVKAIEDESLTLGMLQTLYLASPQHAAKREPTRHSDKQALARVVGFLGADRNVLSLSESDVKRFTMARRQGATGLMGLKKGTAVRDRTIEQDLLILSRALNWAQRERTSTGRRLLKENPWQGIRLPRERNPRRPLMNHTTHLKLLEVADQVHPLLKLALVLAEGTGRRVSAWRNLRWDDVDLQEGTIRWRAEHDKGGYEDVRPMSDAVREALREARKVQKAIGSAPVFPAPKDPTRACDRHLLDNWLRKAFAKAEVKQEPGGMWHTLRRKWATERKGYPVKDVAAAGGWRDERTILTSYQQSDAATVRQVVLHPTQRLVGG